VQRQLVGRSLQHSVEEFRVRGGGHPRIQGRIFKRACQLGGQKKHMEGFARICRLLFLENKLLIKSYTLVVMHIAPTNPSRVSLGYHIYSGPHKR
jgi:hypothetical protein